MQCTALHYTTLQLHDVTLDYITLYHTTLHNTTRHYSALHYTNYTTPHHDYNCNCTCKYTNYTTLQLQLHYTILQLQPQLQLQLQLRYTTLHPAVVVGWSLQPLQPFQKNTTPTTCRSISGFALPSVIHNNQPLLYVSCLWNFRHRLVRRYW